jgi:hypothetical protein
MMTLMDVMDKNRNKKWGNYEERNV